METTDHHAACTTNEDAAHAMLLALLASHGGSLDIDAARFAEGAAGGTNGAVELVPLDTTRLRLRAVPPAGAPAEHETAHFFLLGVLAALGGHADLDHKHFGVDTLGTPDGAFHRVVADPLPGGSLRLHIALGPSSAQV